MLTNDIIKDLILECAHLLLHDGGSKVLQRKIDLTIVNFVVIAKPCTYWSL